MGYELVIGIEVHAQLKTATKLFSPASNDFGADPNTNITPICLGLPGALPVLNKKAVELAVRAGLSLNCTIKHRSVFSRKNYFYADLPKGYQISQFDLPICEDGYLDIDVDGEIKRIGIERIHMEEDAGKLVHQGADAIKGATSSLVDLNRAGVPLIEIVSRPDIRSIAEARAYVEGLKLILQHSGVCDGNLEEGSMRADINISLRPTGQKEFGTRTEIKNINSFRSLERAIKSEVRRQTDILESGGKIIQQTRNYDDATQSTTPLREKENAHDYRYFPEPDLVPLVITDAYVQAISDALPERPAEKLTRYTESLGLTADDSMILIYDLEMCEYFEACMALSSSSAAASIAKWVVGDVNAQIKHHKHDFSSTAFVPQFLVDMVDLIEKGTISGKMAKDILVTSLTSGKSPAEVVQSSGMSQISDESALVDVIQNVFSQNQDAVEKLKEGKMNVIGFIIGQVMKETKGQAKPDLVKQLVMQEVSNLSAS